MTNTHSTRNLTSEEEARLAELMAALESTTDTASANAAINALAAYEVELMADGVDETAILIFEDLG